jgi:hypothetical protein
MNWRSVSVKLALLTALACSASGLRAQDGLQGAIFRDNATQPLGTGYVSLLERRLVGADFDGDQKLDGAVLLHSVPFHGRKSFRLEVHLSASSNTEFSFESTEDSLSIAALDINHDGATDLVVERALTHQRLYVWLGDGRGSFHQGRVEDFPADGTTTDREASGPSSQQQYAAVSVPSGRRFHATLLRASQVSGRPPSAGQLYNIVPTSRSLLLAVVLASRAPPVLQST